jgi:hypothetical protein
VTEPGHRDQVRAPEAAAKTTSAATPTDPPTAEPEASPPTWRTTPGLVRWKSASPMAGSPIEHRRLTTPARVTLSS